MNKRMLPLIVTIIAFSLPAKAATITANTVRTADRPVTAATEDPSLAAERLVQHINYARVALAMKNASLAQEHVLQAKTLFQVLKDSAQGENMRRNVASSRVHYGEANRYGYYPIETGPIKIKKVDKGPFWAGQSLAVTDADIVTLSIDVSKSDAKKSLAKAESLIGQNKWDKADAVLASLSDSIVKVEEKKAVPGDMARDNIALAQNFIARGNYDGARFSLKHADSAIDDMEFADKKKMQRRSITKLRQQVDRLRGIIAKRAPNLLEKAASVKKKTVEN